MLSSFIGNSERGKSAEEFFNHLFEALPEKVEIKVMPQDFTGSFEDYYSSEQLSSDYFVSAGEPANNSEDDYSLYKEGKKKALLVIKTDDAVHRIFDQGFGLGFAEGFINGDWGSPNLFLLQCILTMHRRVVSQKAAKSKKLAIKIKMKSMLMSEDTDNSKEKSPENIQSHYDLDDEMYKVMLGETMAYTCAFFHKAGMGLDEAQRAKWNIIGHKLRLKPGMRVLDIGCGFGTGAQFMAEHYGVHMTGVTLSKDQHKYANENICNQTFESGGSVTVKLMDYRDIDPNDGLFDAVYSIGFAEHVGRERFSEFFQKVETLLTRDGLHLLHVMGSNMAEWNHSSFINKYIFPGAEVPTLANLMDNSCVKGAWQVDDLHCIGTSYANTLRCWEYNVRPYLESKDLTLNFKRVWVYYLLTVGAAFRSRSIGLWQVIYSKKVADRCDEYHDMRDFAWVYDKKLTDVTE